MIININKPKTGYKFWWRRHPFNKFVSTVFAKGKVIEMFYGFHEFGWLGMIVGWLFVTAVLVGVVLLIIWAVRRAGSNPSQSSTPQQSSAPQGPSPKDIAHMRYAKGEITRDEYLQIITDLKEAQK